MTEKLTATFGAEWKNSSFLVELSETVEEDSDDPGRDRRVPSTSVVAGAELFADFVSRLAVQLALTSVTHKRPYGLVAPGPIAIVMQKIPDSTFSGSLSTCDPETNHPGKVVLKVESENGGLVQIDPKTAVVHTVAWRSRKDVDFAQFRLLNKTVRIFRNDEDSYDDLSASQLSDSDFFYSRTEERRRPEERAER